MDEKRGKVNEVASICEKYNITAREISKINSGSSNVNYLISSNEKVYILKCMPKSYYPEGFVEFQNRLTLFLIENNIVFVPNVPINDQYVIEDESSYWQLREYNSDVVELDMGELRQIAIAARNLAYIHALSSCVSRERLFLFARWNEKNSKKRLDKLKKIIKHFLGEATATEMMLHYERIINSAEMRTFAKYTFASSIIHGDFHAGNLFFKNDQLVQIIDWDTARINASVFDFAKALYLITRVDHGIFENDQEKMLVFCKNYFSIRNITFDELQTVPFILELNYIPEPEYLVTFGNDEEKIRWYLQWTFMASKMVRLRFATKYYTVIKKLKGKDYERRF